MSTHTSLSNLSSLIFFARASLCDSRALPSCRVGLRGRIPGPRSTLHGLAVLSLGLLVHGMAGRYVFFDCDDCCYQVLLHGALARSPATGQRCTLCACSCRPDCPSAPSRKARVANE